jgi:aminoglycoside 6'-N-acetyltransferase
LVPAAAAATVAEAAAATAEETVADVTVEAAMAADAVETVAATAASVVRASVHATNHRSQSSTSNGSPSGGPFAFSARITLVELKTERLLIRDFSADDLPALQEILAAPSVRRFWPTDIGEAALIEEFTGHFTIEEGGRVVGILEIHEEPDPDYPSVAFDISIAEDRHGLGLGPEALVAAARHFIAKGHHRFTIDPNVNNASAIRAYEKVGFKRIGVARQQERQIDGTWEDGLLMDLLANELIDGADE